MTDAILKVKRVKDGGAVTLTDAMTGKGIRASLFGVNVGRTEAQAMEFVQAVIRERGITLVDEKPEYIRADVCAAQLAERDVRIAELEAALRDIARWRQEDQDDVEIAILQWRGCVAIARGALGITDVTP